MFVFNEQPGNWTRADRKLLEAYQVLQDEKCGDCQRPVWLCHSDNPDLQWEVRTQVCYATKARAEWQEKQAKKKNKKSDHGVQPAVIPYMLSFGEDNTPQKDYKNLPTRGEFFKAQAEE